MALREILVRMTTPAGGNRLMVTYWDTIHPVANQMTALRNLFNGQVSQFNNTCTYFVVPNGREVNPTTGQLIGAWTSATLPIVTGTNSGQAVPDTSQLLIRWTTGIVVNGRFVQGRSYIPGLTVGAISGGNVLPATGTSWDTALATFVGANLGFSIWHRPVNGAGGQAVPVTAGQTWNEWAVLRRRRA